MGVWNILREQHFRAEVSTHYVNLRHVMRLPHALDIYAFPSDQHSAWHWQDVHATAVADEVHPYVRMYAQLVVDEGMFVIVQLNDHANSTAALSKLRLL